MVRHFWLLIFSFKNIRETFVYLIIYVERYNGNDALNGKTKRVVCVRVFVCVFVCVSSIKPPPHDVIEKKANRRDCNAPTYNPSLRRQSGTGIVPGHSGSPTMNPGHLNRRAGLPYCCRSSRPTPRRTISRMSHHELR